MAKMVIRLVPSRSLITNDRVKMMVQMVKPVTPLIPVRQLVTNVAVKMQSQLVKRSTLPVLSEFLKTMVLVRKRMLVRSTKLSMMLLRPPRLRQPNRTPRTLVQRVKTVTPLMLPKKVKLVTMVIN